MSSEAFTPELLPSIAQNFSQLPGYGLLEAANFDPLRDSGMGAGGRIAFIDPTVADYQTLINGIKSDTKVVVLDPNKDGVQQITDALTGEIYSEVHIVSHGSPGSIQIGSSHLGYDNITDYAGALQQWQKSLTPDADILLYGCNVAADELLVGGDTSQGINSLADSASRLKPTENSQFHLVTRLRPGNADLEALPLFGAGGSPQNSIPKGGISFLSHLADLTGADIAASDDLTGSAAQGGDWDLEVKTGNIEADITFVAGSTDTYNSVLNNGDVIWAKSFGGSSFDDGSSIATDSSGNTYTTGRFNGIATFGSTTLTSNGGADIFVTKLGSDGSVAWAKNLGGSNFDEGTSIATDSSGNTYITGRFDGTTTFGSTTLTSNGNLDIFVAKLGSDGSIAWAKSFGGSSFDYGYSIATDSSGNTYTTGNFIGTATFGSTTLTSKGSGDIFVTKLGSDGSVAWAKSFGGSSNDVGKSIATDSSGNLYTTGYFSGTATFGSTTLTSNGSEDIFVTKLGSDGSVAWAKNFGGSSVDMGISIATDSSGNLYTTGNFYDTATFGSTTLTSKGFGDIFVAKLGSDGSVAWAKSFGGSSSEYGNSIATDSSGNLYTTGWFSGTATFGSTTLTSRGSNNIFVTKLGSDGSVAWAKSSSGSGSDYGISIATDSSGNTYTTGGFGGTATFGSTTLTSKGGSDIFVTKLGTLSTPPNITLSGVAPSYTENAAPVVIDSNATVTDSDSPNFNNGTLTVQFTAGGTASDRLAIRNEGNSAGQIGTDGSIIKFGGVQIGTFAGGIGTAPLVITLNASATPTIAQALLRNITYANASENPSTAGRTVSFVLTDGGGGTSNTVTKNISVTAVDDTEFVVTNTNNSGEGSLRQAILNANADPGTETIAFNIAGGGVKTISPTSALPTIADAVIIDGTTQPGFSNTPLIELNGSNAGANTNITGLKIAAGNSTVRGLIINRFRDHGIQLSGGGNNLIEGNFIGTNAAGNAAAGNGWGIYIFQGSTNNTIGGTTAASRNVISGNSFGITIFTDANKVQGNYIGTDVTGTANLGNSANGVSINGFISASNNLIGGTTPGARNIISGNNQGTGVSISQRGATNNQVIGNYIGTDVTGTLALGNSAYGVDIQNAPNNAIGGTEAGERNVISGNGVYGIFITGTTATGNKVQGNYIGTNAVGTSAVGNGTGVDIGAANNIVGGNVISGNFLEGVAILGTAAMGNQVTGNFIGTKVDGTSALGNRAHGVVVGSARNNTIGGTDVGAGNTIAFNGGDGVLVYANFGTVTGDRISSNSIWANSGIGIDLGDNGVTANDVDDADTGANNLQNFPVFATVSKTSNTLNVTYKVPSSNTNSTYPIRIEFFLSDGNGEGKTFLGVDTYNTPNVDKTFSFTPTATVNFGDKIVATATDNNGNTSEFSIEQLVINPNTAPILDLNGGASGINYDTTFTRAGGAIAVVDTNNLTLTDDGNTLNSATVRITNLLNGASEVLSAVTTGTNINASYNNGILTLTGSDTVTNYQTVLRSIAYNNTAVIPNTTARNIEFVVNDGSLNSTVAMTTLAINMPTISLGSNITAGTRSRPRVASLNNTTAEVLYSFNLSTATRVVANLMMNGGNVDVALLDSNGTILASSIRGGTLAERIDRAGLSPGNYFIRVYQASPNQTVNYQLAVNFA